MYDIIGDIHGYADTLAALLVKLGYNKNEGFYAHPKRKAIFVGDFVDRGPKIRETLQIAKAMVDNQSAMAVLGNHEYNAMCFHTPINGEDRFLRSHSSRNINQHFETINAFLDYQEEWQLYLNWFRTLPLFIELDGLRVVHACWDETLIDAVRKRFPDGVIDTHFLIRSASPSTQEYEIVETLLKGYEVLLPFGTFFSDRDGTVRSKIRVRWWEPFENATYRGISLSADKSLPETSVPEHQIRHFSSYAPDTKPVFFGHYWNFGQPEVLGSNVCCVDYSVAKNEKLVAYRWNGEQVLLNENFVVQECVD